MRRGGPRLITTFGNHEFDNRDPKILLERLNESAFRWVSTNVRWCNPNCDQRFPKKSDVIMLDDGSRSASSASIYPLKKS